jgi:rhodanese-related sulfurtransferase
MKKQYLFLLLVLSFVFIMPSVLANPMGVPFSTIGQYKATKGQFTLIDVRSIESREESKKGILDAIWIDPESDSALESFEQSADKEKTYVVFCSCPEDGYSIQTTKRLVKDGFQHVSVLKGGWDVLINNGIKTVALEEKQQ